MLKDDEIPSARDARVLRHVRLEFGYTLLVWTTGKVCGRVIAREAFGYAFRKPDGTLLFAGDTFTPSAGTGADEYGGICQLLGWLTIRPGDTDDDYFKEHTPEQLAWLRTSDAEEFRTYDWDHENRPDGVCDGDCPDDCEGEHIHPCEEVDGPLHDDERARCGVLLHHWHSGMDAVYAVGSFWADGDIHPDREVVERARAILARDAAAYDAEPGIHGWTQWDRDELGLLDRTLARALEHDYP